MAAVAVRPDDALECFTGAVFDHQAAARGLRARWAALRADTRTFWREGVARAAAAAAASQRSALTGEPIPNAPDPVWLLALNLASLCGQARSRATTVRGRRTWRSAHSAEIELVWLPAVRAGRNAIAARGLLTDLPELTA